MKDFACPIKEAHEDYYQNVEGPIGGEDRFRWVAKQFFSQIRGKKILEIGCGEGSLLKMLAGQNEVYGVDISSSGVEKTKEKGIPCHLADASNDPLPYEDNFFDIVITLETIEHVENPHRMLWEIKRVLKEGGPLLISIPGERVYHPFIYPGLFTRRNFSDFLKFNAFSVQGVAGWGQAPLLSHWSKKAAENSNVFMRRLVSVIFYLGRKRNLFFRKRTGTPIRWAFCINFWCVNHKTALSRVEAVAHQTTPGM